MNYEKEDQAMPEEELFDKIDSKTAKISGKKSNKKDKREKKTAKVKVQSLVQKNEIKRWRFWINYLSMISTGFCRDYCGRNAEQ